MTFSQYLQNIYTVAGVQIYFNVPHFVASLLNAGGCSKFPPNEYKAAARGDYLYKIYKGKRPLTTRIKESTQPINEQSLKLFFEKAFPSPEIVPRVMDKFGLPPASHVNTACFIEALIKQYALFISNVNEDIPNIVPTEYIKLITQGKVSPLNENTTGFSRGIYNYSLAIYEDDLSILYSLETEFYNLNKDDEEKYFINIFNKHVTTDIIAESTNRDIDAYIIDISRPGFFLEGGYTDYSYSGKDLIDALVDIKFQKAKEGKQLKTVFFIYSSMITEKLHDMFDYSSSLELNGLTDLQREEVLASIEFVYLNKATYSIKAVSRRIKVYFDQKFSNDYLQNML